MLRLLCVTLGLMILGAGVRAASYLDEAGSEVYAGLYKSLDITLPERVAHDPQVWQTLDLLKREPCDQKGITDLGLLLERLGYRRQAAVSQYNFVKRCGEPVQTLHKSVDILLKLSDYPMALEVADEFVRRAPANFNAHYMRGVALEDNGFYDRALIDFADTVELFTDKTKASYRVFEHMANNYAKLGRVCEAASPIMTWVALDPANRDTSRSRKIIADYEAQGDCAVASGFQKERFAVRGSRQILAKSTAYAAPSSSTPARVTFR